jgi:nucleotide-binding universal stress UspA family protein
MKTIIVPVDFSKESMSGLEMAILMAAKAGSDIQMVHVISGASNMSHGMLEKEHDLAKTRFGEIVENYKGKINDINLSYIIKEGKIYQEIKNQAEAYENSMIILSTHGNSGIEEFFVGSNSYKIASSASRPVISVRSLAEIRSIRTIVLPLDMTKETREKVPFTTELAKLFNAGIRIVTLRSSNHVNIEKKLERYSKQVGEFLEKHEIPFKTDHLSGTNFTDITLDYALSVNADLISIMTEQEESISNFLLGNYAHQMINKAPMPVLLFPTYNITIIKEGLRTQGVYVYEM